jgi:hypothetical protein
VVVEVSVSVASVVSKKLVESVSPSVTVNVFDTTALSSSPSLLKANTHTHTPIY